MLLQTPSILMIHIHNFYSKNKNKAETFVLIFEVLFFNNTNLVGWSIGLLKQRDFEGWLVFLLKTLLISHQKVIFHFPAVLCSLTCILCMPYIQEFSESCQELGLKQQQVNILGSFYKNF